MEPNEGLLRRSLRRINPFKSRIFRLPATPRLARSRKVGAGCEDSTGWNFERTQSLRGHENAQHAQNPLSSPKFRTLGNSDRLSRASSSTDYQCVSETLDLKRHHSPPPDPIQAETSIARHMQNLFLTNTDPRRKTQTNPGLLKLPLTQYGADGHVTNAVWNRDSMSPNVSTISLLNTNYNTQQRSHSLRTNGTQSPCRNLNNSSAHINGLFPKSGTLPVKERSLPPALTIEPLFSLDDFYSAAQLDEPFIGREWVFKELYEHAILKGVDICYVEGQSGAGKSTVINQIIMHSCFYKRKSFDTMDSGCEADSQHYEWLKAVSARLVAYHVCSIQDAASCAIPELVCNLGAMLARAPVLRNYADILAKNVNLQNLLNIETCLEHDPAYVFKKAIAEPLAQLTSTDQGCLIIIIDGIDEAEFHRSEAGHSIVRFIASMYKTLPSWIRLIVSAETDSNTRIAGYNSFIIKIDDTQLNPQAMRDTRMLAEYRVSVCRNVEEGLRSLRRVTSTADPLGQFIDCAVAQSCGNMTYVSLLLALAESDLIRIKTLTTAFLPTDLDELYLLFFNLTFSSMGIYAMCAPLLSLLLASLRPLDATTIVSILTLSSNTEVNVNEEEILSRASILSPFISCSNNRTLSLRHSSVRDWLLKSQNKCRYNIDAREGHLLLAVWLTRKGRLSSAELFDLAHHLLKANPHKYFSERVLPELTVSRECQITWLDYAAENLENVLLSRRNILFPNTKVTRLLILAGASTNPKPTSANENSLLTQAAVAGDIALVALLMQYGADISPDFGMPPVVGAAGAGHLDTLQVLHQHGALQGESATYSMIAAASGGHLRIVSFLLECDWHDPEAKNAARQTALEKAANAGEVDICAYFLDGMPSNTFNLSTAMREACLGGRAEVVQFLLSRGASFSSTDWPKDQSPLICAVSSGSWDLVVAVLNKADSDVNWRDAKGKQAVHFAAANGHVGLIDLLIKHKAEPDCADIDGWTPLMHAVAKNSLSCVQLLIERGANILTVDKAGQSVLNIACICGTQALVEYVADHGARIEDKNPNGQHPIEIAIEAGNSAAVTALLRRGARLRSATWNTAKLHHHPTLIVLLQKLIDDAVVLFRKRKIDDSLQRLNYALIKCDDLLNSELTTNGIFDELRNCKCNILIALARTKRHQRKSAEAINHCTEAAIFAENDDTLFDVIILRAKCHFDNQDLERARADARAALQLRPFNEDAKQLLASLTLPANSICPIKSSM